MSLFSLRWFGFLLAFCIQAHANSDLDPRRALYSPSQSKEGGQTGNGGDATVASQTYAIAKRASEEVHNLCANHPEIRAQYPCVQETAFSATLPNLAYVPAERVYLCSKDRVVIGGLRETDAALTAYAPCLERDAINFGPKRDADGRQVILLSAIRYVGHLANLAIDGPALLQNILHEILTLTGGDRSDSYASSETWVRFLSTFSRLSRIYRPSAIHSDLAPLIIRSNLGTAFEDPIYTILAERRYARPLNPDEALYRLNATREGVSGILPDGSQDTVLTLTLERLSDQGVLQSIVSKSFRYNTLRPEGELPYPVRKNVQVWLQSSLIPMGCL